MPGARSGAHDAHSLGRGVGAQVRSAALGGRGGILAPRECALALRRRRRSSLLLRRLRM
jgi:hypothetical protein